jgi:hypothetical protein
VCIPIFVCLYWALGLLYQFRTTSTTEISRFWDIAVWPVWVSIAWFFYTRVSELNLPQMLDGPISMLVSILLWLGSLIYALSYGLLVGLPFVLLFIPLFTFFCGVSFVRKMSGK